jgi:hypothetical protein
MVRVAVVLAAIAVMEHLAPELLDLVAKRESFLGATFGNPILLAGSSPPRSLQPWRRVTARGGEPSWCSRPWAAGSP